MTNPFGSESSAYHFLFLTVIAFALVVIASAVGGTVAAVVVWVVVSLAAIALYAIPRSGTHRPRLR